MYRVEVYDVISDDQNAKLITFLSSGADDHVVRLAMDKISLQANVPVNCILRPGDKITAIVDETEVPEEVEYTLEGVVEKGFIFSILRITGNVVCRSCKLNKTCNLRSKT